MKKVSREVIKRQLIEMFQEIVDDENMVIEEDSSLMSDMALSSIEILAFLGEAEAEFEICFEESRMRQMTKVADLIDYIEEKTA